MSIKRALTCLIMGGIILTLSAGPAFAGNMDPANGFAWGENVGWINFATPEGNVSVNATDLTGYAWGENVGWISLNCSNTASCGTVNYAVSIAAGVASGYAWGENVGWISFNCSNTASCGTAAYGVTVDAATGIFSGYAWGENVGWISFNCLNTTSCLTTEYHVATLAISTPTPSSTPGGVVLLPTPTATPTPLSSGVPVPTPTPGRTPTPTPRPSVRPPVTPPPATPTATPTHSVPPSPPLSPPSVISVFPQVITNFFAFLANLLDSLTRWLIGLFGAGLGICSGIVGISACSSAFLTILAALLGIWALLLQFELWPLLLLLLALLGLRRKPPMWGSVYDMRTKRPIPYAKVELFDQNNRRLELAYADRDGHFGFFLTARSQGIESLAVYLRASKPGFVFPTRTALPGGTDYFVYDNPYAGGPLMMHGDLLTRANIPMDCISVARARYSGLGSSLFGRFTDRLLALGFFIGLIAVPLEVYLHPGLATTIIAVAFFLAAAFRILLAYRPYGSVIDGATGKPLANALVMLTDGNGVQTGFAVSDESGRYVLPIKSGISYTVTIHSPVAMMPPRSSQNQLAASESSWSTEKLTLAP